VSRKALAAGIFPVFLHSPAASGLLISESIAMTMLGWLRSLRLLSSPELLKDLGERKMHLERIGAISYRNPTCRIHNDLQLLGYSDKALELGQGVSLCGNTLLAFGDELNGWGRIRVGDRTWVGPFNNLRAGGGDIQIGKDCLISQFCTLVATNHGMDPSVPMITQPPATDRVGVVIGDDVWLGAGSVITPGTTIETGAVIGANSVVTHHVPAYEIWAGVPAKKIGQRQ